MWSTRVVLFLLRWFDKTEYYRSNHWCKNKACRLLILVMNLRSKERGVKGIMQNRVTVRIVSRSDINQWIVKVEYIFVMDDSQCWEGYFGNVSIPGWEKTCSCLLAFL